MFFAQQIDQAQDEEAVAALRSLAAELLPGLDWHLVAYTYTGAYPHTPSGHRPYRTGPDVAIPRFMLPTT